MLLFLLKDIKSIVSFKLGRSTRKLLKLVRNVIKVGIVLHWTYSLFLHLFLEWSTYSFYKSNVSTTYVEIGKLTLNKPF